MDKDSSGILVGFLGNFNSGKTYFLSQLIKKKFRQGLDFKTRGLNLAIEKS